MVVFELLHTYYIYKEKPYYSLRSLGFFDTKEALDAAVLYYLDKPGYVDAPDAFIIRTREILGYVGGNIFFESLVYAHTEDCEDYEYTIELGLYSREEDAKLALQNFQSNNKSFYNNTMFEIEEIVNKLILNKKYCEHGFVVEPEA